MAPAELRACLCFHFFKKILVPSECPRLTRFDALAGLKPWMPQFWLHLTFNLF
jgi:hypothetical protein